MDIFPWLGDRPIKDINAPELLTVLRRIEGRGAHEKAQRAREYTGRVFSRYAIQTGRAERDPSGNLKGALTPAQASLSNQQLIWQSSPEQNIRAALTGVSLITYNELPSFDKLIIQAGASNNPIFSVNPTVQR